MKVFVVIKNTYEGLKAGNEYCDSSSEVIAVTTSIEFAKKLEKEIEVDNEASTTLPFHRIFVRNLKTIN